MSISNDKLIIIANNWSKVDNNQINDFKNTVYEFLKFNNYDDICETFKCGVKKLFSSDGYCIKIYFSNKIIDLKLDNFGFSRFEDYSSKIETLILDNKITYINDLNKEKTFIVDESGNKNIVGVSFVPFDRDIDFLINNTLNDINYRYKDHNKILIDRLIIILDYETVKVFDKNTRNIEFKKHYNSVTAYNDEGVVTCDICKVDCTDKSGNMLPEFSFFYHCYETDFCDQHVEEATKGLDIDYLIETKS